MAIIWGMRSDSATFAARYSIAGLLAGVHYQTTASGQPTWDTDATAIGGKSINMDRGTNVIRQLSYPARGVFTNQAVSILLRAKFPGAQTVGVFEIAGGPSLLSNMFRLYQVGTAWNVSITNQALGTVVAGATLYNVAPTADTWYDVLLTWDGTTGSNGVKMWLDAVNVGSATGSLAASNPRDAQLSDFICIGGVDNLTNTQIKINEMVIWDSVIDPSSVALVSGTGALNGALRTSFVDVAVFDGTLNTDPGVANVRLGTAYTIAGVAKTAILTVPSLANTKTGVAGDGGTGTYDGSDRHTDPGISNVRVGTAYKSNSTSNNRVGTLTPVTNIVHGSRLIGADSPVLGGEIEKTIITTGDAVSVSLVCLGHDLTGASLETKFKGKNGQDLVIPNGQHTVDADQINNLGAFVIALTAANTAAMADGESLEMITKVTQGGAVVQFLGQDVLTVRKSTFRN